MPISFPAPLLYQGGDEDLLVAIGAIVCPGFVTRASNENGLRLWAEGDPRDPAIKASVREVFQTLLGALRTFRADAGELREEQLAGLGAGSVRDEAGNQWVQVGRVLVFTTSEGEVESFAIELRDAVANSRELRDALTLNGRPGRTAADYYMILEYARQEFEGPKGVCDALGVTVAAQKQFSASANNLSPLDGGRHAPRTGAAPWSLRRQRDFTLDLLRRWIWYRSSMRTR